MQNDLKADSSVHSVAFSPDGTRIAVGSWDKVRLWDARTRKRTKPDLTGHGGPVKCVAFSPDGRVLASTGWDGTIRLGDVPGHRQLGNPFKVSDSQVYCVAFSPDGAFLAATSGDGIQLWHLDRA